MPQRPTISDHITATAVLAALDCALVETLVQMILESDQSPGECIGPVQKRVETAVKNLAGTNIAIQDEAKALPVGLEFVRCAFAEAEARAQAIRSAR